MNKLVNLVKKIRRWYRKIKFQTRVTLLINVLIFIIFIALSIYFHFMTSQNIREEVGNKALAVAESLATSPSIIEAFDEENPTASIQDYTNKVQQKVDAQFIVVGDRNEIRIAHPIPNRIGKKMVGDDNERALEKGESYTSLKEGSIGLSIRGKAPIIKDGEIVGVVSVGYLLDEVNRLVWKQYVPILILLFIFLVIGIIGSYLIARHLKHILHKMEPEEIASLLLQREAILQSAKEGIIAVDSDNKITLMNTSAMHILQLDAKMIGKPLEEVVSLPLLRYATEEIPPEDMEYMLNNESVLLNVMPLKKGHELYGAVATFRKKTDLEKVTKELTSIKQYSEGLRAQTHEFSNKIHTLYGLLQLEQYDEAKQFIKDLNDTSITYYPSLDEQIKDPIIQALLIAKYNIANEKGISFELEENSHLDKITNDKIRRVMLVTLGNLIDNAFTAVLSKDTPYVLLHITDVGTNLIIEIDDNGEGIPEMIIDRIFEDGVTTKDPAQHGKGLYIVKQSVHSVKGEIIIDESDLGGARFIVFLPKKGEHK